MNNKITSSNEIDEDGRIGCIQALVNLKKKFQIKKWIKIYKILMAKLIRLLVAFMFRAQKKMKNYKTYFGIVEIHFFLNENFHSI